MAYSQSGALSTANSTSTPLNNAQTFTGTGELSWYYPSVTLTVATDQSGILYGEFSTDGTNWDTSTSWNITGGISETHRVTTTGVYYRTRFLNNSGVNQTFLRISTIYGAQVPIGVQTNAVSRLDADSTIVRNIGEETILSQNLVQGLSVVSKFGRNSDIDTGTVPEDIWDGGGTYTGFPTGAPEQLQVFSSSASDTGVLTITYLASNTATAWQMANVTLNGVTPVNTGIVAYRVHTAMYSSGAPTTFNVGTITIRHATTTANVFSVMPAGMSQTYVAAYTVPAGSTAYIRRLFCRVIPGAAAGSAQGGLWIRPLGGSPRIRRPFGASDLVIFEEYPYGGLVIPAGSDIILRATLASANNLDVSGGFDLILAAQV